MGKWHKVNLYPTGNHPCTGCQMGWGSASSKFVNGEYYSKIDTCDETCERLKNYIYQKEEDAIISHIVHNRGKALKELARH